VPEPAPRLSDAAHAELARFSFAESTASTQDWALAEPVPARGCALFQAGAQTAGRGRRGRAWQSPPGATLAFSLTRSFALGLVPLAPLGLAVGVLLAEGLDALGVPQARLQWPNDVLLGGAKLAGVLVEGMPRAGERTVVAIGVGLNLDLPDDAPIDQAFTDLRRAGCSRPAAAVRDALLDALLPGLSLFEREGFAAFHARFEARDALRGQPVRVLQANAQADDGVALGISVDGALRVCHGSVERLHRGGEVSVRVAA